ncbi:MAG: cell division protein ZapA [Alphaproteobacteria bacterium]
MGQVAVSINGRDYRISCDEGQEERLERLAAYVDEQIADLVSSVGNVGDVRLMVMASLLVADKLFDGNNEIERLRAQLAQAKQGAASETDATVAPLVEAIARRVEDIATELEST